MVVRFPHSVTEMLHRPFPRLSDQLLLALLCLAIAAGIALHAVATFTHQSIHHDDGISYMAASGHAQDYHLATRGEQTGRWLRAERWKRFTRIDDRLIFAKIAAELSTTDIHPPLYFWLLHVWMIAFGTQSWTGPALNLLLHLGTTIILFRIVLRSCQRTDLALAACALWLWSPAVLEAGLHTRPYALFGFLTLLTVDLADLYVSGTPRRRHASALAVLVFLGMLTHYQFGLVVCALLALLFLRTGRWRSTHLLRVASTLVPAAAAFFLVLPNLFRTLLRQQAQAQNFDISGVPERLTRFRSALVGFVVPGNFEDQAGLIALLLYGSLILLAGWHLGHPNPVRRAPVCNFFLFILSVSIFISYLGSISPRHAMGERYLEPLWSLLAIAIVLGLAGLPTRLLRILGTAVVISFLGGFILTATSTVQLLREPSAAVFDTADRVITDNLARGVLPGIFWHIPELTLLWVDSQASLLEDSAWLQEARGHVVYVSRIDYGSTLAQQVEIAEKLAARQGRPSQSRRWGGESATALYDFDIDPSAGP